mmetsp:Transcript_19811/g.9218  ORF Transcript_19811/g.9218 Transcript_19811/m.9218 type:complete len:160 (+) Transcript_19811:916-1395(+)
MKQKYILSKDKKTEELIIEEFAEFDNVFSNLYTSKYPGKLIAEAVLKGRDAVVSAIRTPVMFPIDECAKEIAQAIIELSKTETKDSKEVYYNDSDSIVVDNTEDEPNDAIEDLDDEVGDNDDDDLIEFDELLQNNKQINISSPPKIAEDEPSNTESERS